jgi:hypothetical protein
MRFAGWFHVVPGWLRGAFRGHWLLLARQLRQLAVFTAIRRVSPLSIWPELVRPIKLTPDSSLVSARGAT